MIQLLNLSPEYRALQAGVGKGGAKQ